MHAYMIRMQFYLKHQAEPIYNSRSPYGYGLLIIVRHCLGGFYVI